MNNFEKIKDEFHEALVSNELWEMAGVAQKRTGLKVYLYISPAQGNHGPRIKFVNDYSAKMQHGNLVPMTISDNPEIPVNVKLNISNEDIAQLKSWIILNKDILLNLWNGVYDDEHDAIELLKRVGN